MLLGWWNIAIRLHSPDFTPWEFPLFNTLAIHPATLLGKRYSSGMSYCFLLSTRLLHHHFQCSDTDACCHWGVTAPRPNPPLPCWTWPTTSWLRRSDLACSTDVPGVHFLPVARVGAVPITMGSLESVSDISSLTFAHLNSSTRLGIGTPVSRCCRVQRYWGIWEVRATSQHRSSLASVVDWHDWARPRTLSTATVVWVTTQTGSTRTSVSLGVQCC